MIFINKYKSPNFNNRKRGSSIEYIIIHYTALENCNSAISYLTEKKNKVSSHFLISKSGKIYNLVNESKRAWHAGQSSWKNITDINSHSIGIELDYLGLTKNNNDYPTIQIKSLIKLLKIIIKKYEIDKKNILGHSDIAPYRKIDPGAKFPWCKIYKENLSFFPKKFKKIEIDKLEKSLKNSLLKTKKLRAIFILGKIGYDIILASQNKNKYQLLIKAYQSRFRQKLVSGRLDKETYNRILCHYNQLLTNGIFSNN